MPLLYQLPLSLLFLLVMAPCLLFGVAGVWLVRRNGWMLTVKDNNTAALVHAFVGVLYAVALGLMVVGVQSGYSEVQMVVMKEAYLAEDLYIDADGLSEPMRSKIHELAKSYVDAVIEKEWPAIAKGDFSDQETHLIVDKLAHSIAIHEPESDHELVVFAEMLSGVNQLLDLRRERLHLGGDGIGIVTWTVVALGGLLTIGVACFYNTQSARAHHALVGTMSLMFTLMIFLIVAMDRPLWGTFSVSSDPFIEAQSDILEWEREFSSKQN